MQIYLSTSSNDILKLSFLCVLVNALELNNSARLGQSLQSTKVERLHAIEEWMK